MAFTSGIIACLGFGVATILIVRSLKTDKPLNKPLFFAIAAMALAFHAIQLHYDLFPSEHGIQLGVTTMASLFGFVLAASGTLIAIYRHVVSFLAPAYPSACLGIIIAIFFKDDSTPISNMEAGVIAHILLSIAAYCLIALALSQAILLGIQNYQLKHRHLHEVINSLPPLQTMESMLFDLITFGMVFLSAAITTGFLFVDDLFAQHLIHKTVFALGSWGVLLALLLGRKLRGWRGMVAVRWTLSSFILLTLGYFGSKVVLELILHRA